MKILRTPAKMAKMLKKCFPEVSFPENTFPILSSIFNGVINHFVWIWSTGNTHYLYDEKADIAYQKTLSPKQGFICDEMEKGFTAEHGQMRLKAIFREKHGICLEKFLFGTFLKAEEAKKYLSLFGIKFAKGEGLLYKCVDGEFAFVLSEDETQPLVRYFTINGKYDQAQANTVQEVFSGDLCGAYAFNGECFIVQ